MKTIPVRPAAHAAVPPIRLIDAPDVYQAPIVVSSYGTPGSGKSRLIGTAPGSIGLLPTESKSKQTVLAIAREFGRHVILPDIDLNRTANPMLLAAIPQSCIVVGDAAHKNWSGGQIQDAMQAISKTITLTSAPPDCCQRHYYRWHVNRVKAVSYQMLADDRIRTIAVDTFGTFVDDVSYANYGVTGVIDPKEFGFAPREDMNKEIREWLNNMSVKNLVLTHHSGDVWKDGKPLKGKTKPASAFGKIGHFTSIMVEQARDDDADLDKGEPKYILRVKDCQANASIIGLDLLFDEGITFQNLALQVYPESDPDFWE